MLQTTLHAYFKQKKQIPVLPVLEDASRPDLRLISAETLGALIREGREEFVVVDNRFQFEFAGGHITGAVNVASTEDLKTLTATLHSSTILIFHCEFSECRAPTLCRWLRNEDRRANAENFPLLSFPHLYVLKGGYAEFFEQCQDLCEPKGYIQMRDKGMKKQLKEEKARLRKANPKTFNMF
jgi:M-phase inducer tyrosine phosphatase